MALFLEDRSLTGRACCSPAAFWTWLWGFAGLLLSVPITVCLVVMGKYVPQLEFLEVLLGDEPALEPYQRLYQRLLTSNRDEADVVLEQTLREHSLREVVRHRHRAGAAPARGGLRPGRAQARAPPRAYSTTIQQWVDELLEGMQRTDGRGAMSWQSPSILCFPAEDQADAIIAKLLAAVLINRGIGARVAPLDRLEEEIATSAEALEAVVISAMPPEAVPPARAAVKRIRARAEALPVIVGLWGLDHDLDRAGQRLGSVGVSLLETRVADCVERIEGLRHAPGPSRCGGTPDAGPRVLIPRYTERLKHRRVAQW